MKNKNRPGPNAASPTGTKLPPCFFTIDEVAERLVVSPRTVHRWIAGGKLVVHRVDRSVRISEADFKAFLAVHRDAD
ncbi:MAG TPA: helix-turn-helix domain-containing protein [Chthoniobacterales bacterium]|nr:helix-turn-helix domain-containing protein [Chthoniobacterales bacterium]